ncbi:MAG TPA: hypothetical protein VFR37_21045 [Longimicrobium sp.]|nr:hypothetical protein [Longimicrobium sp.]
MPFSLHDFGLREMLRAGLDLRRRTADSRTLEALAGETVRYFYDECRDEGGGRECVLVRFYKTHPYGELPPELQAFARGLAVGIPAPEMQCLTLLATAGDEPEWNARTASRGHQAIPLPSAQMVEQAPMIAELVRSMGLDVSAVVAPHAELVPALTGKTFNVFHVPEAEGSPYIPAQDEFVRQYRVRSVVGFGGILVTGDFYAVILFSRVPVTAEVANRFRNLALDLKLAISASPTQGTFDPPSAADPHGAEPAGTAGA